MALSAPRTLFGIHQVTLYNRISRTPYGTMRVLGGSSLAITGEVISLTGGSSRYAWEAQDGNITAELVLKPKEIPNFLIEVLLGKTLTQESPDPGSVSSISNVLGTSIVDALAGISAVQVTPLGGVDNLKFGKYIVQATSETTVQIYGMANVDFKRGASLEYSSDLLSILSTPLSIVGAVPNVVPNLGVELLGAAIPNFTIYDTAQFEVYPPYSEKVVAEIGGLEDNPPEFGAIVTAQKKGDGSMWMIDCYKVKALGFPFNMDEKAYSEAEITGIVQYDADKDGVFEMHYLKPALG